MKLLINIDVPVLAPALAFYLAAFGLHVGRRFGDDAIELLGADAPVYLLHKAPGTHAAGESRRDYARHWTPIHCDVVVDDLDAALARAIAAGAVQEGATRETV
ncbi:MAG: VOC family protein, partial [Lysobacter sp.]